MNEEEKKVINYLESLKDYYQSMTAYGNTQEDRISNINMSIEVIKKQSRIIKIKDNYLDLIYGLAVDYDGSNTVEGLKSLIDEIVKLTEKAIKSDDKTSIYLEEWHFNEEGEMVVDKKRNILGEEIWN